jgi:hypothetical protein
MRVNKLLAAMAASALVSTPVMANPAAPLSLANAKASNVGTVADAANVRARTWVKSGSKLTDPAIYIGLGVVALGVILIVALDDDSDSN